MTDYISKVCGKCEITPFACSHKCQEYSEANLKNNLEKQAENVKNTIFSLSYEKHYPPVPRVSGFGISDKTAVLSGSLQLLFLFSIIISLKLAFPEYLPIISFSSSFFSEVR